MLVGGVGYAYHLGEVEITVGQYVEFLNTVDPAGRDRHDLYTDLMSPSSWPKYGSITRSMGPGVGPGRHYSVAYPQWTNKPFGFANFLRAARFVNSLFNGDASSLNPDDGDVVNAATQPLSTYSPEAPNAPPGTFPTWCPPQAGEIACNTVNPLGLPPATYQSIYQGNLSTVGQALTTSPWGTRDQGGNAVEWTRHDRSLSLRPQDARVWRRLHGGVANASAFQLWISAIGLQPQDIVFLANTYPWLGFRVGVIGNPHG